MKRVINNASLIFVLFIAATPQIGCMAESDPTIERGWEVAEIYKGDCGFGEHGEPEGPPAELAGSDETSDNEQDVEAAALSKCITIPATYEFPDTYLGGATQRMIQVHNGCEYSVDVEVIDVVVYGDGEADFDVATKNRFQTIEAGHKSAIPTVFEPKTHEELELDVDFTEYRYGVLTIEATAHAAEIENHTYELSLGGYATQAPAPTARIKAMAYSQSWNPIDLINEPQSIAIDTLKHISLDGTKSGSSTDHFGMVDSYQWEVTAVEADVQSPLIKYDTETYATVEFVQCGEFTITLTVCDDYSCGSESFNQVVTCPGE